MKVLSAYDSSRIGSLQETPFGVVDKFLAEKKKDADCEGTFSSLRNELLKNKDSYATTLARETGNPLSWCRDEVGEAIRILDSRLRIIPDMEIKEKTRNGLNKSILESIPGRLVLSIGSKAFPLLHFIDSAVSALMAGSKTVYRPSIRGAFTIQTLWKNAVPYHNSEFLPVFLQHGSSNFRRLISFPIYDHVVIHGTQRSWKNINKMVSAPVTLDRKYTASAIVWDGDLDIIARSLAGSLRGIKSMQFTPKRILVKNEILDYICNAVAEESLKIGAGDPTNQRTEIPCFLSSQDKDVFYSDVESERKEWNKIISEPVGDENSSSPAIIKVTGKEGPLWGRKPFWPFMVFKGIDSIEEGLNIISHTDDGAVLLYSEDMSILGKFLSLHYNIIVNPPGFSSPADYIRLESGEHRYLLREREIYYYS